MRALFAAVWPSISQLHIHSRTFPDLTGLQYAQIVPLALEQLRPLHIPLLCSV